MIVIKSEKLLLKNYLKTTYFYLSLTNFLFNPLTYILYLTLFYNLYLNLFLIYIF